MRGGPGEQLPGRSRLPAPGRSLLGGGAGAAACNTVVLAGHLPRDGNCLSAVT